MNNSPKTFLILKMDDAFSKDGLIDVNDLKDKNKSSKFWLITHYSNSYANDEFLQIVNQKLSSFPHIEDFVFQLEEDSDGNKHIHMAIGLNDSRSKPVRQFVKVFPDSIIQYIKDIDSAREYCSKKYSRVKKTKPVFNNITSKEKERLISLGKEEREINLMQQGIERKIAIMLKKKDTNVTDLNIGKKVHILKAKVKVEKKIETSDYEISFLICEIDKSVKKIGTKSESKEIDKLRKYVEVLINKEKERDENDKRKIKDEEDEELLKKTTDKVSKLVKKKKKLYDKIDNDIKENREAKASYKIKIKELIKDKKNVYESNGVEPEEVERIKNKVDNGEILNYNESTAFKRYTEIDGEIKKYEKYVKETKKKILELSAKLESVENSTILDSLSDGEDTSSDSEKITKIRSCKKLLADTESDSEDEVTVKYTKLEKKDSPPSSPFKLRGIFADMRENSQLKYSQYDHDKMCKEKLDKQTIISAKILEEEVDKYKRIIDKLKEEALVKDQLAVLDKPLLKVT